MKAEEGKRNSSRRRGKQNSSRCRGRFFYFFSRAEEGKRNSSRCRGREKAPHPTKMDGTTTIPPQGGSELSSDQLNPLLLDDPTVWERRRLLVEHLLVPIEKEVEFVALLVPKHSRNYLMWKHRRWIVEKLGSEEAELELASSVLLTDSKNKQAWSQRTWILKRIGGWEAELRFCHRVLEKDSFNTFASDQRCRALRWLMMESSEFSRDEEVSYARKSIEAQPWNESAWAYLKCLYEKDPSSLFKDERLESIYVDVLYKEACRVDAALKLEEGKKDIINPGVAYHLPLHDNGNFVERVVDKRGCIHALNLIMDLFFLGYQGNNVRLQHAVRVLLEHGHRPGVSYFQWKEEMPEIVRNVCSLMSCLDVQRICFSNNYRGDDGFLYFRAMFLHDEKAFPWF